MGYLSDLGTGLVHDICPRTGYPRDEHGHLLRTISVRDGSLVEGWDKPGTALYNLTSPYGHLHYATGSGDDFFCYDFAVINAGPRGEWIILHAVVNFETGGYIYGAGYEMLPVNTEDERRTALRAAFNLMNCMDEVRHSKRRWNQDTQYFARDVAHTLFSMEFQRWNEKCRSWIDWCTERMRRFGGTRIDAVIDGILRPPAEPAKARRARRKGK